MDSLVIAIPCEAVIMTSVFTYDNTMKDRHLFRATCKFCGKQPAFLLRDKEHTYCCLECAKTHTLVLPVYAVNEHGSELHVYQ